MRRSSCCSTALKHLCAGCYKSTVGDALQQSCVLTFKSSKNPRLGRSEPSLGVELEARDPQGLAHWHFSCIMAWLQQLCREWLRADKARARVGCSRAVLAMVRGGKGQRWMDVRRRNEFEKRNDSERG